MKINILSHTNFFFQLYDFFIMIHIKNDQKFQNYIKNYHL